MGQKWRFSGSTINTLSSRTKLTKHAWKWSNWIIVCTLLIHIKPNIIQKEEKYLSQLSSFVSITIHNISEMNKHNKMEKNHSQMESFLPLNTNITQKMNCIILLTQQHWRGNCYLKEWLFSQQHLPWCTLWITTNLKINHNPYSQFQINSNP